MATYRFFASCGLALLLSGCYSISTREDFLSGRGHVQYVHRARVSVQTLGIVEGKACSTQILYLPELKQWDPKTGDVVSITPQLWLISTGDSSYRTAYQQALAQEPGSDTVLDIIAEIESISALPVWKETCTVLTGRAVKLHAIGGK